MERSSQHETLKKAFLKLDELQKKLEVAEGRRKEPIAIVGIACRFPGKVRNLEDYWRLLREGGNAIADVPGDRWDVDALYDPNPEAVGKMYSRRGAFLEDVDQFDPQFFGITPREVMHMDPQQRILLEVTWEALERAGIAPDTLNGSRTGVFTGVGFNDYSRMLGELGLSEVNAYTGPGTQVCFATGRVSYMLGLRGPSVPIDTACSSSLVAIHQACQSLRLGESDMALAGGVNIVLVPEGNVWLSRAGALAPDGQCKTFDAAANGFVRGEGCAILVLKRLSDALRDGNAILALIRGSAVNHDGRSSGLTVPSGPAQEALLRQALENAGIEAGQVSYLEAHGTGTSLGDPIELRAILSVHGEHAGKTRDTPLWIGSVKTNLGHLEAASGVAGVVKVVLMLQNRQIPPHLHFKQLNPMVSTNGVDLRVPTELQAWQPPGSIPLIAGVSSFGLSGTNAHVLLEQPPALPVAQDMPAAEAGGSFILPISAAKPEPLKSLAKAYGDLLEDAPATLGDIAFTAAVGRNHLDHRLALVAKSAADAAAMLRAHLEGEPNARVVSGRRPLSGTPRLAFVFPGEDASALTQVARVAVQLLDQEPAFREAFETCESLFVKHGQPSLTKAVRDWPATAVADDDLARATLFSFQVALAALWRSWGIQPDAVVGVGQGEIAAAHVGETLSLEDAAKALFSRGSSIQISTQPSALASALKELVADDLKVFLEMAPEAALAGAMRKALEELGVHATVISSPAHSTAEQGALLEPLAQLYCLGFTPEFHHVYRRGRTVPTLPSYPWQHQRYWVDLTNKSEPKPVNGEGHPLLGQSMSPSAARPDCVFWELDLDPRSRSYPGFQRVGGRRVASSATFAHMALAAAREAQLADLPKITNLELHRPWVLSESDRSTVQVSLSTDQGGKHVFQVHSRSRDTARQDRAWVLHASATLAPR